MEVNENYSFIVIGKTGAGKSSILNSLVGEIKFPEGEGLKSKTKEVCEYHGKLKYDNAIYSIIDTPGFYDSEQEDNKHINNIVNFFKNLKEIGGINCIFYVISLKEQKFDHTLQTCLSLLKTLLGDDVFKMIKIIYTFKNDLSNKAYVKALDRFKDLPQLLVTSGFPVTENLETFIFDYDEQEEFLQQILQSTKNSPKLFPEVLNNS
jgi:GTPase Era involved in 16S rRNA processing